MDRQLATLVASGITDSGQRLKAWIDVLDDLATAHVLAQAKRLQHSDTYEVHEIMLELALAVTRAYAQCFNRLVAYGVAANLPGVRSQLESVARCKDVIANPQLMFDQLCAAKAKASKAVS